ncbi:MAG: PAS domain S-box protein [Methylococcaceae bacterium]|nr:PAS domain S-box protein [Methylococcaceae bacterium]
MSSALNLALRRGILQVVLLYAAFGAMWILLSDKVLEWLTGDAAVLALASTVKGWAFVAVSSLLLYGGLRRLVGTAAERPQPLPGLPGTMIAVMATVIILLVGLAIHSNSKRQAAMEMARLEAVADVKAGQLHDWFRERQGDGEFIRTSTFFAELFQQWQEQGDAEAGRRLQKRLQELRDAHGYSAVRLLNSDGGTLWSSDIDALDSDPELQEQVRTAARQGRVLNVALRGERGVRAWFAFLVPIALVEPHSIVALLATPSETFSRTLRDWPLSDIRGESLLFRRERDRVQLFSDPDLTVQQQVPASAWPWREGVSGAVQTVTDGSGEEWIGVARPVPDTDWWLLARMNRAEIDDASAKDAWWIALGGGLLLFTGVVVLMLQRQREQLAVVEAVRQSQDERLRALQLLGAVADASEDAIFAKDCDGRYILFNRAASNIVGKSAEQVLGRDDRTLFPPDQAQILMRVDRDVVREGRQISQEEALDTACGKRVFLVVKGPLRDESGRISGIYGISRDITARKEVEEAMRRQAELVRRYLDTVQTIVVALDRDGRVSMINRAGLDLLGYCEAELLGADWSSVCLPQSAGRDAVCSVSQSLVAGALEPAENFRNWVRCRDGRLRLIAWHNAWLTDETGAAIGILSSGQDITELNEAQNQLKASEERLRLALDASNDGMWDWDLRTGLAYLAPRYYEMTGYRPEDVVPDLEFFKQTIHPDDRDRVLAVMQAHLKGDLPSSEFDYRMVGAQGQIRWMRGRGRVVERDESGVPLRMAGTISDIGERKAVEEELRRRTEELGRRNLELERFNQAMVGRELEMIALKRQVNHLSSQLGLEPPFSLAFLEETAKSAGAK